MKEISQQTLEAMQFYYLWIYKIPHSVLITLDFRFSCSAGYYPEAINICA